MNKKVIGKYAGTAVLTIVLGAVGSGVWERVIAPGYDATYRFIVNAFGGILTSYKDSIYQSASRGFNDSHSAGAYFMGAIAASLSALIFLQIRHSSRGYNAGVNDASLTSKIGLIGDWILLIIVSSMVLAIALSLARATTIDKTTIYSIRSVEILRPYIGEQKYELLLSQFYQVRTSADFYAFHTEVEQQAAATKVKLPEFTPI